MCNSHWRSIKQHKPIGQVISAFGQYKASELNYKGQNQVYIVFPRKPPMHAVSFGVVPLTVVTSLH